PAAPVDEALVDELLDLFRCQRNQRSAQPETQTAYHPDRGETVSGSGETPPQSAAVPGERARGDDKMGVFSLLTVNADAGSSDESSDQDESVDLAVDQTVPATDSSGRSGADPKAMIPHTELPTMEMPPLTPDIYATAEQLPVGRDLEVLLSQGGQGDEAVPDQQPSAEQATPTSVESDPLNRLTDDLLPPRKPPMHTLSGRDRAVSSALSATQDMEAAGAQGEFERGQVIEGRFEIVDVRRGGMGVVYLCYDRVQHSPIALKTFRSKFLDNPRAVARFEQEALTWIRLEKHRHIVQARLVETIAGRPHILLEHISGPEGLDADLRSWIEHRRITMPLALEFALGIALGMQHAVQRVPGLVHRDLKPANILVTHDGIAKVTDFGLVRSVDSEDAPLNTAGVLSGEEAFDRLTRAGAVVGTAPYLSPEQCRSDNVDMRSDIYAFGCVL
ncbi:MAG: serine/threonine protein kinase, partial [Anaerolinea sp.]|nr:serine/threonine protein kinase [Anaerolinea sp.]